MSKEEKKESKRFVRVFEKGKGRSSRSKLVVEIELDETMMHVKSKIDDQDQRQTLQWLSEFFGRASFGGFDVTGLRWLAEDIEKPKEEKPKKKEGLAEDIEEPKEEKPKKKSAKK